MSSSNQVAGLTVDTCHADLSEAKGPLDVVTSSISELDVVNVLAAVSGIGKHSNMERGDTDQAREFLKFRLIELVGALPEDDIQEILSEIERRKDFKRKAHSAISSFKSS